MRDQPKWAQALNIPVKTFEEWRAIAPDSESFVYWVLQTGRISSHDYLEWAKDHFELPILTPKYFSLEPNMNLWNQIHTVANWSPWMMPLEQWDGVLFIACVEPLLETKWSFPVRYVLADANVLASRWAELHEPKDAGTKSLIRPEKTTVTQTAPAAPKFSPGERTVIALNFQTPSDETVEEAAAAPEPVAPEGLNFTMPTKTSKVAATGFDALADFATPVDSGRLDLPGFSVSEPTPPAPPARPTSVQHSRAEEIAPKSAGTVTRAMTIEAAPPMQLDAGGIEAGQGPERIEEAMDPTAALAWCFRQLKTRFSSSIVLVHSTKGLQAWKWDANVMPHADNAQEISFEGPSLFRVAARTLRPYHGFVVENPIHKNFFRGWGFQSLPKHVTAIPITVAGTFKGLFLCIASDQAKALDVLEFAEMTVDKTVQQLAKMDSPLKGSKAA